MRSAFRLYWVRAAISASSYGVRNTRCPAVADLSPASQAVAARLAGSARGCACRGEPLQTATPPVWYGLLIVVALASRAGSIAHVRRAAPEYARPASSNPASRPRLPKLAARPLFSSAGHIAWRG